MFPVSCKGKVASHDHLNNSNIKLDLVSDMQIPIKVVIVLSNLRNGVH